MEAYVDQLQVIIVRLIPWLKGDISSSGSLNQRNHTPEPWNEVFEFQAPESEQLDEAETATQICLDLKHLNEIIESRVPKLEQLDGGFESRGAARRNQDQEQLENGLATRKV